MLRPLLLLVALVLGVVALWLAWLAREQRVGMATFGAFGLVCLGSAVAAGLSRQSWTTAWLGGVAIVGALAVLWGLLMVSAITKHFDAMQVRSAELGDVFVMSSAKRVFRVGAAQVRLERIEATSAKEFVVSLRVDPGTEVVLRTGESSPEASAVVGGYRIQLIDVTSAAASKVALYSAHLMVTMNESP